MALPRRRAAAGTSVGRVRRGTVATAASRAGALKIVDGTGADAPTDLPEDSEDLLAMRMDDIKIQIEAPRPPTPEKEPEDEEKKDGDGDDDAKDGRARGAGLPSAPPPRGRELEMPRASRGAAAAATWMC